MTDEELLRFAADFRSGILSDRSSEKMCYAICAPLASLLGAEGVSAELVESVVGYGNHFWLRLPDGRALDPTADQYGYEPVYLGSPLKIHRDAEPSHEGVMSEAGVAAVTAALAWRRAKRGRDQQNARRRFVRRLGRLVDNEMGKVRLWIYAVQIAESVIAGDARIDGNRLVITVQGARRLAERGWL